MTGVVVQTGIFFLLHAVMAANEQDKLFNASGKLYAPNVVPVVLSDHYNIVCREYRLSILYSEPSTELVWLGSWYASYAGLNETDTVKITCSGLFSDVLYRPFQCAHTSLEPYTTKIPPANAIRRFRDLAVEEFTKTWTNTPFILTDPVKQWPVYRNWSESDLIETYADTVFRAESVDWPLTTYLAYMNNNSDESPLYLFDRAFVEKMDLNVGNNGDYWIPECFGEDLFTVLDEQRPDSRWLIIGPTRSGSTFHKDPNATRYVN